MGEFHIENKFDIIDIKELKDNQWKLSVESGGHIIEFFFLYKESLMAALNKMNNSTYTHMMYAHLVIDVTSNKVLKSRYCDVGKIPTYSELVFDFIESKIGDQIK